MALIHEVHGEPLESNKCHIVVLTVLLLFGLKIAKRSIWIYPYTKIMMPKCNRWEYKDEGASSGDLISPV